MLYISRSVQQHLLVDSFPGSYFAAFPHAAGAVTLTFALRWYAAPLWKPVQGKKGLCRVAAAQPGRDWPCGGWRAELLHSFKTLLVAVLVTSTVLYVTAENYGERR